MTHRHPQAGGRFYREPDGSLTRADKDDGHPIGDKAEAIDKAAQSTRPPIDAPAKQAKEK